MVIEFTLNHKIIGFGGKEIGKSVVSASKQRGASKI